LFKGFSVPPLSDTKGHPAPGIYAMSKIEGGLGRFFCLEPLAVHSLLAACVAGLHATRDHEADFALSANDT